MFVLERSSVRFTGLVFKRVSLSVITSARPFTVILSLVLVTVGATVRLFTPAADATLVDMTDLCLCKRFALITPWVTKKQLQTIFTTNSHENFQLIMLSAIVTIPNGCGSCMEQQAKNTHYVIVSPCFRCGARAAVRCWKCSWRVGFLSACSVHMKIFVYFPTIWTKLTRCGIKKIFSKKCKIWRGSSVLNIKIQSLLFTNVHTCTHPKVCDCEDRGNIV